MANILDQLKSNFTNDGTATGCEVSIPSFIPKCSYQALVTDDKTTITITDGNTIDLLDLVKFSETKTYITDLSITGTYLVLKYKGEDSSIQIKSVDLGVLIGGGNITPITVGDTNTVDLNLNTGLLTANIRIDPSSTAPISVSALYGIKIDATPQTPITVVESSTISGNSSGADNHSIQTNVKISNNPNNLLTVDSEGLLVTNSVDVEETPNTSTDSNTVNITLSGVNGRNIQADVNVSGDAGNILQINSNGLYVPTPVFTSYGIKDMFKVGDAGKPTSGSVTYTNAGLIGKTRMDAVVEIQGVALPYADSSQRSFTLDAEPSITGTITLNLQFDTNENVRIYY